MRTRLFATFVGTLSILAVTGRAQPIRSDLAAPPNPSTSPSLVTAIDPNPGAPAPGVPGASAPQPGGNIFEQVQKMIHAGADPAVIKSFVQNWQAPFMVTADDILRLHDSGTPSDVLTALIHRSAELQTQVAANTQPLPPLTGPNMATMPQVGDTTSYSYASPYPAYTYSYLYPYYDYNAYWGWPYYSYWSYPWPYWGYGYWGGYWPYYHNYYAYHGHYGHGYYGGG